MGSNQPQDQNVTATPDQPRQPRNLQGLLRFAMEATKAEDAPGNSTLGPMDEERRKFLEEALKSLTINVAETIQKAINILSDSEKIHGIQLAQELPEDVQGAFDILLEFTDNIDIANDYYKMGGFTVFPVCYGSDNVKIRANASSILGELCQNNPFCQARALECGLVNVLLNMINTEKGKALAKCLYALSCATREFEPACRELISQDGCRSLAHLLAADDENAKTKAAFLIRYLSEHYPEAKAKFIKENVVQIIGKQISAGRDNSTEHLLSILASLVQGQDPAVLRQCRDPALNLRKVLENHLKDPEFDDEVFVEEKEYCQQILKVVGNIGSNDAYNADGADR